MSIVPFRSQGAAADQSAQQRLVQIGPFALHIQQDPTGSSALRPLASASPPVGLSDWLIDEDHEPSTVQWPSDNGSRSQSGQPHLANVGLVIWQSGLVLADLLIRRPPLGPWGLNTHVIDLGTGTGLVGIALAMAGARVTLTDLPHILPITRANVAANLPVGQGDVVVAELAWGTPVSNLLHQVGGRPDVITAADVLYDVSLHGPLLQTIAALAAPHTETYIAYRKRSKAEEKFDMHAEAMGFSVEEAPDELLADEYQGGSYRVLRLVPRELSVSASGSMPDAAGSRAGRGLASAAIHGEGEQYAVQGMSADGEWDVEHKPCAQS